MSDIERISRIDKSKLGGKTYFQDLINEGERCGVLSDEDCERIQYSCIAVLASLSEKYNNGDSSSIPAETAQELLDSILFTVGVKLKACPDLEAALEALKTAGIDPLFISGLKIIDRKILAAKAIHSRLKNELIETENVYYRSTIVDGINGFFKLYYPGFFAQKIHITADYPTLAKINDLDGIEFIETYLKYLYYENRFLSLFDGWRTERLLLSFAPGYAEMPVNLYEPVLSAAIGCVLCRRPPDKLSLTDDDIERLYDIFSDKTRIKPILSSALTLLEGVISPTAGMTAYLDTSLGALTAAVENAVVTHTLDKVFIVAER